MDYRYSIVAEVVSDVEISQNDLEELENHIGRSLAEGLPKNVRESDPEIKVDAKIEDAFA